MIYCPHCKSWFNPEDPYTIKVCPLCQKTIFVEVDEGPEGPFFTAYKEMPSCELYPPKS